VGVGTNVRVNVGNGVEVDVAVAIGEIVANGVAVSLATIEATTGAVGKELTTDEESHAVIHTK
jgi:hypothetical protein